MIQNAFNISIFFLLFLIPIIDVVTNTPKKSVSMYLTVGMIKLSI